MPNPFFQFKQFTVYHDRCAMKVTTDACLFGAWAAADLKTPGAHPGKILDIGTGTGLLTLMLAQQHAALFEAIEIDADAAEQAEENIQVSLWNERIRVVHADIMEYHRNEKYDAIISNPPFYEKELQGEDARKNMAHHSGGISMTQLLNEMRLRLNEYGTFYLLLPYKRKDELEILLQQCGLYPQRMIAVHPSGKHAPIRLMIRGGLQRAEIEISQLFIRNEQGAYSREFISLLKDYYLHL